LFYDVSMSSAASILDMASLLAGSQITITLISMTGFGIKLSDLIVSIGHDNLFLCLLLSMIVCIILGMGLPTTAAYVLAAAILAPALISLKLDPLVAHLFVFFFSTLATITPPVCAAVYLSAGMAQANWVRTGILSCLIALPAFIVPYTFAYNKALLLVGSMTNIVISVITAVIGVAAIGMGVAGYIKKELSITYRLLLIVAGVLMVIPEYIESIAGIIVFGVIYFLNSRSGKEQVKA